MGWWSEMDDWLKEHSRKHAAKCIITDGGYTSDNTYQTQH